MEFLEFMAMERSYYESRTNELTKELEERKQEEMGASEGIEGTPKDEIPREIEKMETEKADFLRRLDEVQRKIDEIESGGSSCELNEEEETAVLKIINCFSKGVAG